MKSALLFCGIVLVSLGGCQSTLGTPERVPVSNKELEMEFGEGTGTPQGAVFSLEDVARSIEAREAAYKQVMEDARMKGIVGGAVRGAVIGLLIENSGAGVVAGAAMGGAIGSYIGERIGANVVQNHRNFLVREDSLQRIIRAAKQDTSDTKFDLLLSDELIDAVHSERSTFRTELVTESLERLEAFRQFAMFRTVTLGELLPLYDTHPGVQRQLSAELLKQKVILSKYHENLRLIKGRGH